jgi:hypothetical protein
MLAIKPIPWWSVPSQKGREKTFPIVVTHTSDGTGIWCGDWIVLWVDPTPAMAPVYPVKFDLTIAGIDMSEEAAGSYSLAQGHRFLCFGHCNSF